MDVLAFVSSVIASVIWPLVVVLAMLVLQKQLRGLVDGLGRRLKSIKGPGGFQADFSDELKQIQEVADDARLPPAEAAPSAQVEMFGAGLQAAARLGRLAEISPGAAVLDAWREIETMLRRLARRKDLPDSEVRSTMLLVRYLNKRGIIDSDIAAIINDLRSLRNSVAHAKEVDLSLEEARSYVILGARVIARLRNILGDQY